MGLHRTKSSYSNYFNNILIWPTFATGPYSGHAVITAASYVTTSMGPRIVSLVLRDPWPSASNIATSGRVEIGGGALAQFAQYIRSYWLVSVSLQAAPTETRVGSPDSVEEPVTSDDSFCNVLAAYADAAPQKFRSLRGPRDTEGTDPADHVYKATRNVPGYHDCEIWIYGDSDEAPSAACDGPKNADEDSLWSDIQSCYPNSHGRRNHQLSLQNGVTIRLSTSRSGVTLWIDSPVHIQLRFDAAAARLRTPGLSPQAPKHHLMPSEPHMGAISGRDAVPVRESRPTPRFPMGSTGFQADCVSHR